MSLTFYTLGGASLTQGYKYFAPTAQSGNLFWKLRPVGPLCNSQVRSAWYGNKKSNIVAIRNQDWKKTMYATKLNTLD